MYKYARTKKKIPFAKGIDNDVIQCVVEKCSKLVWTFNLEKHIRDKHSDLAPVAVSKLTDETSKKIKKFKTSAQARLTTEEITKNC